MANCITRHIPNTVTCLNLFSGCIACVMAFHAKYEWAMCFIVLSAIFDFFDGMLARMLHAYSNMGKELDSLADDVSFGVVPALMVFSLFKEVKYPSFLVGFEEYIPFLAFIIAVFSALRLAKFNVDERQTSSFVGLPTPANALFWGSLIVGSHEYLISDSFNAICLLVLVLVFSYLLVAEIPMFSLKFKNLTWKDNKVSFIFLFGCILLFVLFGIIGSFIASFAAIILWYILLSVITIKRK